MRYYFNYAVMYVDGKNYLRSVTMTADNPEHLQERFRQEYPDSYILSYVTYDGVLKDRIREKKKLVLKKNETYLYIESLSVEELIDSKVSEIYDEYSKYCTDNGLDPDDVGLFSKKIQSYFKIQSKVCKIGGKVYRVYKEA